MDNRPQVPTPPAVPEAPTFRDLVRLLREDRAANLREWTYPGFQALLAYRIGRFGRAIRLRPARGIISLLHRALARRAIRRYGIELALDSHIGRRVRIIHQNGIVIHPGAVVGDDCWIRQGSQVGTRSTRVPAVGPVLGRDVRLGVNAAIAPDVVIGDGARIGPNCVITADVPPGASTMQGRPRKIAPSEVGRC